MSEKTTCDTMTLKRIQKAMGILKRTKNKEKCYFDIS